MAKVECPSCFFDFEIGEAIIEGELISCPDCGVDLEVTLISGERASVVLAEMTNETWG